MQVYELAKIGFIFYGVLFAVILGCVALLVWLGCKLYRRRKETRATRENRPPDYSKL